jgi:hypothetical protein
MAPMEINSKQLEELVNSEIGLADNRPQQSSLKFLTIRNGNPFRRFVTMDIDMATLSTTWDLVEFNFFESADHFTG